MTAVRHAFVSTKLDSADATKVRATPWNDGHLVDWGEAGDVAAQAFGDTAAAGVLDEIARADHRHAMPDAVTGHVVLVAAVNGSVKELAAADYICDGVADDVQINAAIAAASGGTGGTVQLSSGVFTISSWVELGNNRVRLIGAGMDITTIRPGAKFTGAGIRNSAGTNWGPVYLADFTYDGLKATYPATPITSSSIASPTVFTTATAHGLTTGQVVNIRGHAGSTPAIGVSDDYTATVISPTTFSIPVNVTTGGTGGTVLSSHGIDLTRCPTAVAYNVAANSCAGHGFLTRGDGSGDSNGIRVILGRAGANDGIAMNFILCNGLQVTNALTILNLGGGYFNSGGESELVQCVSDQDVGYSHRLLNSNRSKLIGCVASDNHPPDGAGGSMVVWTSDDVTITACRVLTDVFGGSQYNIADIFVIGSNRLTISDTPITDTRAQVNIRAGVWLDSSSDCKVIGNSIKMTAGYAVYESGSSDRNIVIGNSLEAPTAPNIVGPRTIITHNTSYISPRDGINARDFGALGNGVALDAAALQAAWDAVPDTAGATWFVPAGTYNLGTTTLNLTGYNDQVVIDAGAARFIYSGTGVAINMHLHRAIVRIGKVEAVGAAIASSTAIAIDWRTFWGRLDAWIGEFQAGTAIRFYTTNSCDFPFLRIQNCKIGLYTDADAGHNNFGVVDFRVDGGTGVTDPTAMKVVGAGAVGFAGCVFQRFNCVYNHSSGNWTLIDWEDFIHKLTILDFTYESLSSGDTRVVNLNRTSGSVGGVIYINNWHPSNAGGGPMFVTGNAVNLRFVGAGKNLIPEQVYDPQVLGALVTYNASGVLDATDGRLLGNSLRVFDPNMSNGPQVEVMGQRSHPAPGSPVVFSFAVKSNRAGVLIYPWLNSYDKASVQQQGIYGPNFKVPAINTWYLVTVMADNPVQWAAAKSNMQLAVQNDTIASDTEIKFSEIALFAQEARPTEYQSRGATSVADGGTIAHNLPFAPRFVRVSGTVAGEMVSHGTPGATTFPVAIKKHDNTAGTTQVVDWEAEL